MDYQDIITNVCNLIAKGDSVRAVFRDNDLGVKRTKFYELLEDNEAFANQYACACEDRSDFMFEEILEIADENNADAVVVDGETRIDGNTVQRSRLKIDARKWMLGKMQPTKYGDKVTQVHEGGDKPVTIISLGGGVKPI